MSAREELKSKRKEIIEKHENALDKEAGLAILALALTIGFFGSSAVLMPEQGTPTGMFSGDLDIRSPVVESLQSRNEVVHNTGFSFVLDSEVRNPNVVDVELENVVYQIKSNGETIKSGVKDGETVIEAPDTEWVALEYGIDFAGVPNSQELLKKFEEGDRKVSVDGTYRFNVAGEIVELPFEEEVNLE